MKYLLSLDKNIVAGDPFLELMFWAEKDESTGKYHIYILDEEEIGVEVTPARIINAVRELLNKLISKGYLRAAVYANVD